MPVRGLLAVAACGAGEVRAGGASSKLSLRLCGDAAERAGCAITGATAASAEQTVFDTFVIPDPELVARCGELAAVNRSCCTSAKIC